MQAPPSLHLAYFRRSDCRDHPLVIGKRKYERVTCMQFPPVNISCSSFLIFADPTIAKTGPTCGIPSSMSIGIQRVIKITPHVLILKYIGWSLKKKESFFDSVNLTLPLDEIEVF